MPIPKTAELLEPIKEQLKRIEDKLDKALEPKEETETKLPEGRQQTPVNYSPIPQEYRNIVDELLTNEFGIKIIPDAAEPKFSFQVIVPKKYSNSPDVKDGRLMEDVRSKVLTYGDGALGVRTYVELIKSNLGPEIMAQIEEYKRQNYGK